MKRPFTHLRISPAGVIAAALLVTGCTVYNSPPPPPPPSGPVVEGPGVTVIEVEPPPDQREYIYDPGYPPGTYYYPGDGCYYYGDYRYPHDVFINEYVVVNQREHRYIDRDENQRMGGDIVIRQREEFARTGGRRVVTARPGARPAGRPEDRHDR